MPFKVNIGNAFVFVHGSHSVNMVSGTCVMCINQLDKPNFCGKATRVLSVVEKVRTGTDHHRICNVLGKSAINVDNVFQSVD